MKYLSKLSRRMASMLCIPLLMSIAACNLAEPEPLVDGLEPPPPPAAEPPVTGPPAAATRTCDNRPADYNVVLDVPWSVLPVVQPGVSTEGFWFARGQANTLSIIDVPDAPLSPGKALRIGYPKGAAGGGGPSRWGSRDFPANQGSVYVCAWVRISLDYSNNGNVGTKFFFMRDPLNNHFVGFDSPDRNHQMYVFTGLQFRDGSLSTNVGQVYTANNSVSGGGWHKVEIVWGANTPGQKNGTYRQWVDGALTAQSSTVMWWLAGQSPRWTSLWFDPTFGGGLNRVPHDQWIDVDHMVVALK